jgi:hypothetical protein
MIQAKAGLNVWINFCLNALAKLLSRGREAPWGKTAGKLKV